MPRVSHRGATHLGLDVHRDSISVAILDPRDEAPEVERIFHDEPSVRRLIARFPDPRALRACYEAGPTGYELHRLLATLRVRCDVVAPSLIPKAPGDRVKTDRRDCRRLARLHRAGELVVIRVPTPEEEAVRDLCRARADMVEDRTRARHRLSKFLLRHGRVYREGAAWTLGHERWMLAQRFQDRALAVTYGHYRAVLCARDDAIAAVEADLVPYFGADPFGEQVARLAAYRGVSNLGALTVASEVCDWRRFARATQFMGFCGLVPSEYSSGESRRRGHITRAGNAHLRHQLVESAWSYSHRAGVGAEIRRRHDGLPPEVVARAWKVQLRLCGRYRRLAARKSSRNVVITAVARELAGHLWAEMTA
jgi:transposase